ncbi:MAG: DUF4097 family beta strand repeat-containing protein [Bacteroidota bacterium]|nr:DUF4097 family beta strand repeat-containing protein [Bacteroidota bacterium]
MKTLITFLTLALCAALPLQAQEYDRVEKKSFKTTATPDIVIDSRFGTVNVHAHGIAVGEARSGDRVTLDVTPGGPNIVNVVVSVHVAATSESEAKRLAASARVEIKGDGKKVSVRTGLPKGMDEDSREQRSITIDVNITAPTGSRLNLESKFGNVNVMGITGRVMADCGFGSVEITRCANVRARNSFGDITLAAIKGSLELEAKMGGIIARHIEGGKIHSSYGDVEISDVKGTLEVTSSMGSLSISGMRNGEITSSYGSIDLTLHTQFAGRIEATSSFGSIDSDYELQDVGKKGPGAMGEKKTGVIGSGKDHLVIKSSFGSISIEQE